MDHILSYVVNRNVSEKQHICRILDSAMQPVFPLMAVLHTAGIILTSFMSLSHGKALQ